MNTNKKMLLGGSIGLVCLIWLIGTVTAPTRLHVDLDPALRHLEDLDEIPVAISEQAHAEYVDAWLRERGIPVATPEIAAAFRNETEQSELENVYHISAPAAHDRAVAALDADNSAPHLAVAQIEAEGKIFRVPDGTRVAALRTDPLSSSRCVRILAGRHAGKIGYVSPEWVK